MKKLPHYIEELPLLKWIVSEWTSSGQKPLKGYKIFLIIHLLKDSPAFMESLLLLGADPKDVHLVGKPYSTLKQSVTDISKKLKFKNIKTTSTMREFHQKVENTLKQISTNGNKILILEDGGYSLDIINKLKLYKKAKFYGIVEQTTVGIWRDEEAVKHRKPEFPIVNVAKTPTKSLLEPIVVGQAIAQNIVKILMPAFGKSLNGKTILVVGYGSIGKSLVKVLKETNVVYVQDKSALARLQARQDGLGVHDLNKIISNCDLVIGCSGNYWADAKKLLQMKHNAYFVCATSERVEYDHDDLLKHCKKITIKPSVGLKLDLINGKTLYVLAEGYPINFYGASKESMPFESFQIIGGMLLWGLLLLTKKQLPNGIDLFPSSDEEKLCNEYETIVYSS